MSIVTISRGSYSKGKIVAEAVAERLGYECISREIVLEASEQFNIPQIKLVRAIHDAPTILDRLTIRKSTFIAFFKVALLRHLVRDNVVYHGLAGHFLVNDVPHAVKIRIIADWEDRVRLEMERNGLARDEAEHLLAEDDEQRRKWSLHLHGIDTADPSLYDLVIHIGRMSTDDAVEIICHTVGLERFRSTDASQKKMRDVLLAAEVELEAKDLARGVAVTADDGKVLIRPAREGSASDSALRELAERARALEGVREVEVSLQPSAPHSDYSNPWYKL